MIKSLNAKQWRRGTNNLLDFLKHETAYRSVSRKAKLNYLRAIPAVYTAAKVDGCFALSSLLICCLEEPERDVHSSLNDTITLEEQISDSEDKENRSGLQNVT